MRLSVSLAAVLVFTAFCPAQEAAVLPREVLNRIVETEPNPLPKSMAEGEQLPSDRPTLDDFILRSPPTGTVTCPPEYAQNDGLLISWDGYTSVLTELTVGITTGDSDATVYVVVDSASEQTSATSTLTSAGADMSQVEFIICITDTVWIRDYGPRFIYEDGQRAIIDHTYNRPRPNDNLFNNYLSALWGEPQYDIPLTHGGGNFHLFSNGDAFMSSLILSENPGLTEQDVKNLYAEYQGLNLTIYTGFPTSFDSTRHIDMWMLPVGDDKVIIGQYDSSTGAPYTITENAVADLQSRGYTVYRTPGWNSGGTHYTYTNAVILNDQVFISYFGSPYQSQDAEALAVFQAAMPDHTVHQVYSGEIIHAAGAIHCIVMHVPPATSGPIPPTAQNGAENTPMFTPVTCNLSATDDGLPDPPAALDYVITSLPAHGILAEPGGAEIVSVPHTLSAGSQVTYTPAPCFLGNDTFDFKANDGGAAPDGGDSNIATITISVSAASSSMTMIYDFPLDTDPGWTLEGGWEFGPAASGGTHNLDPAYAYTGTNVLGYVIGGDYPSGMTSTDYLTTSAMDCSGLADVQLRFRRWLGVESSAFDHARIDVSTNGVDWLPVWANGTTSISDTVWSLQTYDLSAVADGRATVLVRWGMGPTDSSVSYPGWNIDDVQIWARTPSPADLNGDSLVGEMDYRMFAACFDGPALTTATDCTCADLDADGDVDLVDFAGMQAEFGN